MKLNHWIAAFIVAFTLTACGGGGSGGENNEGTVVNPVTGDNTDSPENTNSGDNTGTGDNTDSEGNTDSGGNSNGNAPTAENLSLQIGLSPYVEIQLIGADPQNDSIQFILDSSSSGNGYEDAFIDSSSGKFYVTILDDSNPLEFIYRTTDGSNFSDPATITVTASDSSLALETGLSEPDVDVYGDIPLAFYDGDLYGSSPSNRTAPPSIDLSGNLPTPGNQGDQGSCTAWAVGYALKSYQEKIEENWSYSPATLFSPSFIYNQTNLGASVGQDAGSQIFDALQLIVDKGAATLQSFPYSDQDFETQPNSAALAEAAQYKARSYSRLSGLSQVKSALANRQPVVLGMITDDSFMELSGPTSVYNTTTGMNDGIHGRHAVTAVGYDDSKFGGAVKVINSWGTNWGDDGYFWIAYSLFAEVVEEAYVLEDGPNTGSDPVVPDPPSPTSGPNLQISDWSVEYNPQPGGEGLWQWQVVNSGDAAGGAGADVNLMLSRDSAIDNSDIFVVYEELPNDLAAGASIGRGEGNERTFEFPETLEPGSYYMAVWVDDLSEIDETDETDNVAFGENTVEFSGGGLPDIAIESWAVGWDPSSGDGTFEYSVLNNGTSATTSTEWDINLILSTDIDRTDQGYYLFYEDAGFIMQPGDSITRDQSSAASFNLFREAINGDEVVPGTYFIGVWVDDSQEEEETNEINNLSFDNLAVEVGADSTQGKRVIQTAFNGMRIPERVHTKRVEIYKDQNGNFGMKVPTENSHSAKSLESTSIYTKTLSSGDQAIFPVNQRNSMPVAEEINGYEK